MSPLSTTTTRRSSACTLATRIPPNYEPGSRFRVLAPDGSEVDVTVPAGAEAGDMIQVPLTVTDQPNWAPTGDEGQHATSRGRPASGQRADPPLQRHRPPRHLLPVLLLLHRADPVRPVT